MILDSQDINKYLGYLNQKVYNTVTKEAGLICEMRILPLAEMYSIYFEAYYPYGTEKMFIEDINSGMIKIIGLE